MTDDDAVIVGLRRVAFAAGRSPRTISRWRQRGLLPAAKNGPFNNSPLTVRAGELDRLCRGRERGEPDSSR